MITKLIKLKNGEWGLIIPDKLLKQLNINSNDDELKYLLINNELWIKKKNK